MSAWFVSGNADARFLTLAVENLLMELARTGRYPLAVYSDAPPFSASRTGTRGKGRLDRYLERYTSARIPAIRLQELGRALLDARRRGLFASEGARLDPVLITGPEIPESGLPTVADGVVLLIAKGTSTPAWVYEAVRPLAKESLPISIVALNTDCLEEAAVCFHDLKAEIESLLKTEVPLRFAGYLRFEADYMQAALQAGQPLVEYFPGCPFHGQVKYVLSCLSKAAAQPSVEPYFSRMAAWLASHEAQLV